MSSDIGRRAWVTRCTCCPRAACPNLTPLRYLASGQARTRRPPPGAAAGTKRGPKACLGNDVWPGRPESARLAPLGRQAFAYPVTTFPAFTYRMVRHIRHIRHDFGDLVSEAEGPGHRVSKGAVPAATAAPGAPGPGPWETTYRTRPSPGG